MNNRTPPSSGNVRPNSDLRSLIELAEQAAMQREGKDPKLAAKQRRLIEILKREASPDQQSGSTNYGDTV